MHTTTYRKLSILGSFYLTSYLLVGSLSLMMINNTYSRILDTAESLLAKQGYNGFSYKDIGREVDIKTSSIHYHFATKVDLVTEIVKRHIQETAKLLKNLDDLDISAERKLLKLIDSIVSSTYKREKRMCLGAVVAIDTLTLDKGTLDEVRKFFVLIESWIERTLSTSGFKEAKQEAKSIMAYIEGTLLLARLFEDETRVSYLKQRVASIF